jgi:hypothetical protein
MATYTLVGFMRDRNEEIKMHFAVPPLITTKQDYLPQNNKCNTTTRPHQGTQLIPKSLHETVDMGKAFVSLSTTPKPSVGLTQWKARVELS